MLFVIIWMRGFFMYKRILTIQDISCLGQCSITVALPILSAAGHETCIIPSAVLSTHTAVFKGYTFHDLTEELPLISDHWKSEGVLFDAIYTGYLGTVKQIEYVKNIMDFHCKKDGLIIVDPVMGDYGKLYPAFDENFVVAMKKLAFSSDYLIPNITEACLLTDMKYRESYDEKFIEEIIEKLVVSGAKNVIITGVTFNKQFTGAYVYENGKKAYYKHKRIDKNCHGTGDIFASAFTGAIESGKTAFEAAKIAADYTVLCIENTMDDEEHWYGVKFEPVLCEYIKMLR